VIDTHTHLDLTPGTDAEIVEAARKVGVRRLLTVGIGSESCQRAQEAAETFDEVYFAAGRHPNAATAYDDTVTEELRTFGSHPRCVAIGETGLDYYRDSASPADQKRAFAAQIELARELNKPLIIHTRAAEEDTLTMLDREAQGVEVILHCFSMPDRLEECVDRGWWISFAGNVTYPKATELALAAKRAPIERILVETDAPYLTPQVVRKHRNQPAFVVHTAEFIAAQRAISYADFEAAVEANSARLFGW
jgi:TatD DNase family protein